MAYQRSRTEQGLAAPGEQHIPVLMARRRGSFNVETFIASFFSPAHRQGLPQTLDAL